MTIDPLKYRILFLQEAEDQLASYEEALLRIKPEGYDRDAVDTAYRAVHSLKAGADAVGLSDIAKYSHSVEILIDRIRSEQATKSHELDRLLVAFDVLRAYVAFANDPTISVPELSVAIGDLERIPEVPVTGPVTTTPKIAIAVPIPEPEIVVPVSTPVGPEPVVAIYLLTLSPERDAFRRGIDPMGMLIEVGKVSSILKVTLDTSRLPVLAELCPEDCYFSWKVQLKTSRPEDVLDVFSVCGDTLDVRLEPFSEQPAEPAKAKPPQAPSLSRIHPDPMKFVSFLVDNGDITSQQAMLALERQRESRPLIGKLAVISNRMKTDHLFKTLAEIKEGEKFGHAAIRLGFLDDRRLSELLILQQQSIPPISDVILELKILEQSHLYRRIEGFRQMARRSNVEHECYVENVDSLSMPSKIATGDAASLDGNQAMIGDFCQEAADHIAEADKHLLILDSEPTNAESLNAVYRAFHTIKGVASMLGLTGTQTIAHEAENLLNLARESKIVLKGKFLDLSFESCDAIRRQIEIARNWVTSGGSMATDPKVPVLLKSLKESVGRALSGKPAKPSVAETRKTEEPTSKGVAAETPIATSAENSPANADHPAADRKKNSGENETVRVAKNRLDELINLIGELVIAHSMAKTEFDHLSRETGAHSRALPELSKIARDIQELSFSLRMIPLQATFQRMSRLVRDLNRKIGKQVELKLEGEETELDKSVVDQLGDPLMHMVRNAIDHGLETPAERVLAGKPETGHLTIRAFHQGGSVHIEIVDDGKGLDRDRILRKAVEKGIIQEGQRLTDPEIYALIFEPGFSTAAAVTDVSGRGVGMDVVRRNVESLQGSIQIRTKAGLGTTFTIRLPLTLAIMDGLMIGLGDDVYVLPLLSVIESFRPKASDIHTVAGRGETVTARGEIIPLIRLHRVLARPAKNTVATQGIVVLVEDQGQKHALFVDELLGQMQAVVKSLDDNFCRVEGLAGATILGDGRVAMILDIHGLAKLYTLGANVDLWCSRSESQFDPIANSAHPQLLEGSLT